MYLPTKKVMDIDKSNGAYLKGVLNRLERLDEEIDEILISLPKTDKNLSYISDTKNSAKRDENVNNKQTNVAI
ncbi:unnamed protein product [Phyllotreta striolata]|uniref:Uncharacterized protein n=1 Tax=Phyllotreta striolata TaxID=444603 RepID=A0A9N9TUT1_PHYSR|nr:unnamed protein product [Phyllotreta striolata]